MLLMRKVPYVRVAYSIDASNFPEPQFLQRGHQRQLRHRALRQRDGRVYTTAYVCVRPALNVEPVEHDPRQVAHHEHDQPPARGNIDCLLYTSDAADE